MERTQPSVSRNNGLQVSWKWMAVTAVSILLAVLGTWATFVHGQIRLMDNRSRLVESQISGLEARGIMVESQLNRIELVLNQLVQHERGRK